MTAVNQYIITQIASKIIINRTNPKRTSVVVGAAGCHTVRVLYGVIFLVFTPPQKGVVLHVG